MAKKGRSPHGHSLVETDNHAKADWCPRCKKWFKPIKLAKGEGEASGRFILRIPAQLHAELAARARSEGSSLNLLVATLLAQHLGRMQERGMWIKEVNKSMEK